MQLAMNHGCCRHQFLLVKSKVLPVYQRNNDLQRSCDTSNLDAILQHWPGPAKIQVRKHQGALLLPAAAYLAAHHRLTTAGSRAAPLLMMMLSLK